MSLRGDLISLPLWEVLQLLSSGRKTGKFQIEDNGNKVEVFLKDGRIIYAKEGDLENLDALLDLALWRKGTFLFIPDEKPPISPLSLDPFEVLISSEKYIDFLNYLSDFILIPISIEGLSKEEENIVNLFDGKKDVGDVINEVGLSKIKTLEIIKDLMEKGKLIKIDDDQNLFWFYVFFRGWTYILEEFPKKGVSERSIKRSWRDFLNKSDSRVKSIFEELTFPEEISPLYFYRYMKEEYLPSEKEIKNVFENIISGEKVIWSNIYKNVKQFSSSSLENFSKDSLRFLFSLGKTSFDDIISKIKFSDISESINPILDKIFIYIGKKEFFEEQLFSWFLNGERSLGNVIENSIFDDVKTKLIFWKLIEDKKILSIDEDKKLKLLFEFWKLWKEVRRDYKKEKWEEVYSRWKEFLEGNIQEIRYIFNKIILNLTPSWNYIYQNLYLTSEEELRGFLKNLLKSISIKEEGVLGEKIRDFKTNL